MKKNEIEKKEKNLIKIKFSKDSENNDVRESVDKQYFLDTDTATLTDVNKKPVSGEVKLLISKDNSIHEFTGTYENGLPTKGIYVEPNNYTYEGTWSNGYPFYGKIKYSDGDVFDGKLEKYIDGNKEILIQEGKTYYNNGDVFQGTLKAVVNEDNEKNKQEHYVDNQSESQQKDEVNLPDDNKEYCEQRGIMYDRDGNGYNGVWKNGKKEGFGIGYYKNEEGGFLEKWKNGVCYSSNRVDKTEQITDSMWFDTNNNEKNDLLSNNQPESQQEHGNETFDSKDESEEYKQEEEENLNLIKSMMKDNINNFQSGLLQKHDILLLDDDDEVNNSELNNNFYNIFLETIPENIEEQNQSLENDNEIDTSSMNNKKPKNNSTNLSNNKEI